MVTIIIYRAGDGAVAIMPAAEYDGDADTIVRRDRSVRLSRMGLRPRLRHGSTTESVVGRLLSRRSASVTFGWMERQNDYYSRSSGRCVRVGGR